MTAVSTEQTHEDLLQEVLQLVIENNQQMKPGTPLAELRTAIEAALASLPPLEFQEFSQAVGDTEAAARLVQNAPEMIGWNADQIVQWVEELAKKI
jgi:hypothetical protein